MSTQLPQPEFTPANPASGWWKAPGTLATDPAFLRVPDDLRLAAVGLYVASLGWALSHQGEDGWVPASALHLGQACAAPREQLEAAARALVVAGLFATASVGGLDGYVVAGASKAVQERFARQQSAQNAGRASASGGRPSSNYSPKSHGRVNPDRKVDWSQVSEQL